MIVLTVEYYHICLVLQISKHIISKNIDFHTPYLRCIETSYTPYRHCPRGPTVVALPVAQGARVVG